MLGPLADVPATYLGVATVAAVLMGTTLALPSAPPPDADRAARAIDGVATSPYNATGSVPLDAASGVRLSAGEVGLRTADGADHADLAGRVTPVAGDSPLGAVLAGAPPGREFDSPAALRAAAARARRQPAAWRPAPPSLTARRIRWRGVDVTLVG